MLRILIAITPLLIAPAHAHEHKELCDGFMPPNDLHLQDDLKSTRGISEEVFNEVISEAEAVFKPLIQAEHGAVLTIQRRWADGTVNAFASQPSDTDWQVAMFGGLARRAEVTRDGFALVVCHELGHHLGGYPFTQEWAADEGQSDYYATQACARLLWKDELEKNAESRASVDSAAKEMCDSQWLNVNDQNLCYRTAMGGKSLGTLLAALGGQAEPQFNTPDPRQVSRTNHAHPAGQCRLDTYTAGALCTTDFVMEVIPGKVNGSGTNTQATEREAFSQSCSVGTYDQGTRPRCWFKSLN
jgi:hypothetical protein